MAPAMKASRSTRFSSSRRAICLAVGLQEAERQVFHFPICQMPSRLASGASGPGSRARTPRNRASCSACQRSVRRREASRISTMRRSAAMASSILRCISFANRSRRRRRWRAGPPRPVAAPACPTSRATSWPNAVATGSLRSAGAGAVRSGQGGQQGRRGAASVCGRAGMRTTPARAPATPGQGPAGPRSASAQATAWSISARPSASRPSPASCRQEASKGVGASGTGEADMTGKLGGLQGNDQNISTLYTSVCPH